MAVPTLMAGPILRRVEHNKVSVWLAFTQSHHVRLKIWEGDNIKHEGSGTGKLVTSLTPLPTTSNSSPTVQFGARLFIAVVTAELQSPGLQTGKIYSYNIECDSDDPLTEGDLRTHGLLDSTAVEGRPQLPIGYKKDVLPTFVLPDPDPARLVVAQGSCRKMHGLGTDALSYLDKIIEDNLIKPEKRPQQLFLTGDQMYADEVSGMSLRYAGRLDGFGLIGDEKVAIRVNNSSPIEQLDADTINFPVYLRQHLVNEYAGFTTTAGACHLISFEEFCGVYLNYWSIRSWSERMYNEIKTFIDDKSKLSEVAESFLDSTRVEDDPNLVEIIRDPDNLRNEATKYVFTDELTAIFAEADSGEKFQKWLAETRAGLKSEIKELANFAKTLPKVSRVLANVPSYMIFDDHEVTDDWYITQRWKNQVLSKPLGRAIVRNGLMAYAIFQDWGNVPGEYVPIEQPGENTAQLKPRTRLIRLIAEYGWRIGENQKLNTLTSEVLEPLENLLGMGSSPSEVKWHYKVPTGPATSFVLDTRTRREYTGLNMPPGLVTQEALQEQTPNVLDGAPPFVFVVSPAPVMGLSVFEELIQPAAASVMGLASDEPANRGLLGGQLEFDYEAWGFSVAAFERLMDRLNTYQKIILLSGDVHYGFSSVLDYWKGTATNPTSRLVQLTSSSLKNRRFLNMEILKSGMVQRILTGFDGKLEKVGWKDKVLSATGDVTPRNRMRMRQSTAAVPVEGWNPGTTVNHPPDFRWRLAVVADERPEDPPFTEVNPTDANSLKSGYKNIVARHQERFISGVGRRVIWPSHVSLISFEADGANWKVKHELLYEKSSRLDDPKPGAHTQHVIPLTASGEALTRPALP